MKERGILYSAPMVRARRAGQKTQTRRVVQPDGAHNLFQFRGTTAAAGADEPTGEWGWCGSERVVNNHIHCPYGKLGDRLWTREAWRAPTSCDSLPPSAVSQTEPLRFIADEVVGPDPGFGRYRHARFMCRWMSRGLDEVVDVRVERLHDISEADAVAEGVFIKVGRTPIGDAVVTATGGELIYAAPTQAREEYRRLWESINGVGSWGANPWVWVVSFRKL